jgi:hypothetical protein
MISTFFKKYEKLLSENYDTGRRFLSKLTQTLGDVMCRLTDHTTVVSLKVFSANHLIECIEYLYLFLH